ncbi:NIPSNAP family protein [Amycolatopsis jejuensis]|uniref:NIPSNAP family protein n=1 Tax=Amycolatopsis jejuensis TaxID=330084 RepID=UPI000526ECB3|nr:NIPSNAP family protein [Amycolatopsis jejuensis]
MFYEIRRENGFPGKGDDLARSMADQVIPVHEANGMTVLGSFRIPDEDAVVWIRRFTSVAEKVEILEAVHESAEWQGIEEAVAGVVKNSETTRLEALPGSALQ